MMFSVIIPAYNREGELRRSIDSVLEQTYKNFELIIVDNGSTDNTKELLQSYIDKDNRVKYFWQENSGSPAGSRNTGIKNSTANWVAFLDSDDFWYKNKLELVAKTIDIKNDVIAVSHFEDKFVDEVYDSTLEHGITLTDNNTYFELLFNGNNLSTSAMTVRKDKLFEIELFDTRKDYFAVEDYDVWMKLSKLGKFAYIDKSLGVFSVTDNNMSSNVELINNNLKTLVLDHIQKLNIDNKDKLKKIHGSRIDYYKGRTYQMERDFKKAIPILFKSILDFPFNIKKYISLTFALLGISK